MTDAAKTLAARLLATMKPLAKELGLRSKTLTYTRRVGQATHVLTFQASQWNSAERAERFLRAGIFLHDLHALTPSPVPTSITEANTQLRVSLGAYDDGLGSSITLGRGASPDDAAVDARIADAARAFFTEVATIDGHATAFACARFAGDLRFPLDMQVAHLAGDVARRDEIRARFISDQAARGIRVTPAQVGKWYLGGAR